MMNNTRQRYMTSPYLLILSILPFFVIFAFESSFTFQSAFIFIVALVVAEVFSKKKTVYEKRWFYLLIAFIGVIGLGYVVTIFISPQIMTATALVRAFLLIAILWFFALLVSRNYSSYSVKKMLEAIAWSGVASSFLVLYCFIETGGYFGRIYPESLLGIQIDANYFALILVLQCGFAFLLGLYQKKMTKKIIFFVIAAACIISVLLTGSRNGLICIILEMLVITFFYFRDRTHSKFITAFLLTVFVGAVLVLASQFVSDWLMNRFFNQSYNDGSNQFRLTLWANAVQRVLERPLFGFGVGNYSYYSAQDWGLSSVSNAAHGTFFDYLVDCGFVGLILFSSIFVILFREIYRSRCFALYGIYFGMFMCLFVIGAERTVALWLFLISCLILTKNLKINDLNLSALVNSTRHNLSGSQNE